MGNLALVSPSEERRRVNKLRSYYTGPTKDCLPLRFTIQNHHSVSQRLHISFYTYSCHLSQYLPILTRSGPSLHMASP